MDNKLEKSLSVDSDNNKNFSDLTELVLRGKKLIEDNDGFNKILGASLLRSLYESFMILKKSSNPVWSSKEGQDAVDKWQCLIKKIIEES
ncbi:hypothetical protein M0R04_06180 [Candidatus Dojkabacteria bacterium]|jgi:hypothetical protein|nr:hypothetical protein [Candidatus Dojkabacteria bacterium]